MDAVLNTLVARTIKFGQLTVVAASGRTFRYGDRTGKLVRIRFTSRRWQLAVTFDPLLRLGEAYMNRPRFAGGRLV